MAELSPAARAAVGETIILLHPPLPPGGVSTETTRECQQNHRILADGYVGQERADLARRFCCLGYGSTSATKQKFSKQEIQSPTYNRHCQLGWNYRMSEL